MKKILTLLALIVGFTVNAQVQYVQTNNTGSTLLGIILMCFQRLKITLNSFRSL